MTTFDKSQIRNLPPGDTFVLSDGRRIEAVKDSGCNRCLFLDDDICQFGIAARCRESMRSFRDITVYVRIPIQIAEEVKTSYEQSMIAAGSRGEHESEQRFARIFYVVRGAIKGASNV